MLLHNESTIAQIKDDIFYNWYKIMTGCKLCIARNTNVIIWIQLIHFYITREGHDDTNNHNGYKDGKRIALRKLYGILLDIT